MVVDAEISQMLQRLAEEKNSAPRQMTLDQSREIYRQQYLSMGRAPDQDVATETVDLPRTTATLTLYRPPGLTGHAPVVLYLHGGGFVLGDHRTYADQSARIALACGAVIAFLDYRLAPEHPFPAALNDTLAAARWLTENGAALGFDPARLVIMGDSAGGNLAIAALRHFKPEAPFCRAVLLYPVTDLRPYRGLAPYSASDESYATGYFLERPAMEYFCRAYLTDAALTLDPRVSPLIADDLHGLPPVAIYGGEIDLLRDQGRQFANRLTKVGVNVHHTCFDGLIHNFMQHAGISRRSNEAFMIVCEDLRRELSSGTPG
ncbi:alpha/beta hydrolase [Rhizobium terrae]|uniref:alpha/beta hydrolase n=1 Tax=Rhizobium terrae TaxID=2171756 RepID=UPI000E3C565C|nr:alpha/beta hydrolase [Rhizobium terrae]